MIDVGMSTCKLSVTHAILVCVLFTPPCIPTSFTICFVLFFCMIVLSYMTSEIFYNLEGYAVGAADFFHIIIMAIVTTQKS